MDHLLFLLLLFQVCDARHSTPPVIAPSSMVDVTALVGEDVRFDCVVDHIGKHTVAFLRPGQPPRLISYDEKIFAAQRDKYELSVRNGPLMNHWSIVIKNVQVSDRGNYSCQLNTDPILSKTAYLQLRVPPSVSRSTPSAVEVREGQNVTLSCKVEGQPAPTVIWRRQDRQIIRHNGADGFGASVFHGPELNLTSVSRRHMSEYVCVASNGIPPDESWAIKLLVTFPPHSLAKSRIVVARRGQLARIACDVEAWPRPDVTWTRDGDHVHEGDLYATEQTVSGQFTTVHTLEIRKVEDRHYGTYRCTARNDNGLHHAEIELTESEEDGRYANLVQPEGSGSAPPASPSSFPSSPSYPSTEDPDSEYGDDEEDDSNSAGSQEEDEARLTTVATTASTTTEAEHRTHARRKHATKGPPVEDRNEVLSQHRQGRRGGSSNRSFDLSFSLLILLTLASSL